MTLTDSCMTTKNGSSDLVEGLDGRSNSNSNSNKQISIAPYASYRGAVSSFEVTMVLLLNDAAGNSVGLRRDESGEF